MPADAIRTDGAIRLVDARLIDADGTATITWVARTTVEKLKPQRTAPVRVTLLGTACLGPVGPADAAGADTLTFEVAPDGTVTQIEAPGLDEAVVDHLNRAACNSEGFADDKPAGQQETPTPAPS